MAWKLKNLKTVADAVLLKDRVVALTQIGAENEETIGLVFLNGVGEIRSTAIISDPKLRLVPKSMMVVPGGAQMIIAAEAISREDSKDLYSVLIWTDQDGAKQTQKEYLPGVKNKPEYVGRLANGEIVMTGRLTTEDGRDAGCGFCACLRKARFYINALMPVVEIPLFVALSLWAMGQWLSWVMPCRYRR